MAETVHAIRTEQLASLLIAARMQAEARDEDAGVYEGLFLSLAIVLTGDRAEEIRRRIGAIGRARNLPELAALSTLDPMQVAPKKSTRPLDLPPAIAAALDISEKVPVSGPGTPPQLRVPDLGLGRPVSLGERKSLARTRDRTLLLRVLRDPSPDVVKILLENPTLTETDILRLVSRRPVNDAVLREVFGCVRWAVQYRIRLALVKNPHTPLDIAVLLTATLRDRDAQVIFASPELDETVRKVAGLRALARQVPNTVH